MRRTFPVRLLALLLVGSQCYAQSLGEIARQNQKQKQNSGAGATKVYTTDDLSPTPAPKPATPAPATTKGGTKPPSYDSLGYKTFTPELWTRTIKAQNDWIAHLWEEAAKAKTPPKFSANQAATDPEARKYWEERGIQQQLASEIPEQQQKLKDMQFEAQKAGMPESVWDPQ